MDGVLKGIRVIDFGQYIAGPLLGMMLADHGAEVIHIDPPNGPAWDTPANNTWNRGKKSLTLDLKNPADLYVSKKLVNSADVLIENFRPNVMTRLGLGYEAMLKSNPRLLYCSMPGFAADDPRSNIRGWEGIIASATWTYRPSSIDSNSTRPVYTSIPIASSYAAFISAVSISMALISRESYGLGQWIEVPLFDAMFPVMGSRVITLHDQTTPTSRGVNPGWTRTFECNDGRWVQYHSGNLRFDDFLSATGVDLWPTSESPSDYQNRMEDLFKTRSSTEWESLISHLGSEAAICRSTSEWIAHPHAWQSGMVTMVDGTNLGSMVQPGINTRLSKTPGNIRGPVLVVKPEEIDLDTTFSSAGHDLSELENSLPPVLKDVKVLDLCIVLAGPTCGRTLAEFGADVIKIDSPDRLRVSFHNEINRAKRSIVLDLKTEKGLSIFWKLLEGTDVVVQNFRKGVADKLGVGYEQVRLKKPDIIYASLNTYGQEGELADRPGHEQIAQAATGMQERFGGEGQPLTQPFAINDYGTGFMGAYGVALALMHRMRTGEGQHVDTALAYTSCTLQSTFLMDYPGKIWNEIRGQDALGSGPLNRAYQVKDGWVFLSLPWNQRDRLRQVNKMEDIMVLNSTELEQRIENVMISQTVVDCVKLMGSLDISAHRVVDKASDLLEDQWIVSHGLSITREHQELGNITTTGPAPRLSLTPVRVGRPAPKPGSDAKEILSDIGLESEFDRLVEERVIKLDGITPS
jgi:crotonobetainyl-CoA:carnitine CoA-transferase CaiB-like acyl-CoA transferase